MTHRAHDLVGYRAGGDPRPRLLTGGLACYGVYRCADGRGLTLAALEPRFFGRFCTIVGRPELAARQYDDDQGTLATEIAGIVAERPLRAWLDLCEDEDACVGPVWTVAEAASAFGHGPEGPVPAVGEHTEAWRAMLAD
jgi:crotonobetainyl-CoA:carnitine CoA-transferase CaiB-like acyl-CoA transferase